MKFSLLKNIIEKEAHKRKLSAEYEGSWGDGGSSNLLKRLDEYKNKLILLYDLKPSEYHQLDNKEIGEPSEFYNIIEEYKIDLAKNIKL